MRFHMFQLVSRLLHFFWKRKNKRETEKHESATLDSESGRVLMRLFFAQHSVYGHINPPPPSSLPLNLKKKNQMPACPCHLIFFYFFIFFLWLIAKKHESAAALDSLSRVGA